jgi:heavy metal sensor kinase
VIHKNGHTIRTLDHVVSLDGQRVRLALSGITDEHVEILEMVRNSYLISCPLMLIASIAAGMLLSHGALRPVHRITSKARTMGIHELHERLPVPQTGDELQELAEAWNELLGRLDAAINRLTQFTADVSHELRTTITVMLSTSEVALKRQRSEEQYRTVLETIVRECAATSRQLEDLLALARADVVKQDLGWKLVNLSDITAQACAHQYARAEMKRQSLELRIGGKVCAMGDATMLSRTITILLDNAIKYTPHDGRIMVSVIGYEGHAKIEVSDTGIGIPAGSLARVFDRFYRVDDSRSQDDGSRGLGLAIAKWIVDAHGAAIEVASTEGCGSTFTVTMPLHSPAPALVSAKREALLR